MHACNTLILQITFSNFMIIFEILMLVMVILAIFTYISQWKVYEKAGKQNCTAIILPGFNSIALLEIAEMPTWCIIYDFIPFLHLYFYTKASIEVAHKFGKSTAFGVGLAYLGFIFYPILAFGNSTYKGNSKTNSSTNNINS